MQKHSKQGKISERKHQTSSMCQADLLNCSLLLLTKRKEEKKNLKTGAQSVSIDAVLNQKLWNLSREGEGGGETNQVNGTAHNGNIVRDTWLI